MASQNASRPELHCIFSDNGLYIVPCFTAVWGVLFLPLCVLILHTSFQRWRRNKRGAPVSHADFFTYNTLAFELVAYCGNVMYSVGSFQSNLELSQLAMSMFIFVHPGFLIVSVLTCVERYIAVVYPVVYLSLKENKWIWPRSGIVVVVWVFGFVWTAMVVAMTSPHALILLSLVISALLITFCSVQVLRALRNPGPSEGHGASRMKQRAFYTMLSILSALLLWLVNGILNIVLEKAGLGDSGVICALQKSISWFVLPNSLVQPLLFLHRAGRLPSCRVKTVRNTSRRLRGKATREKH